MERCDFMPLTAELASLPFCCGETEGDKDLEDFFHHNALLYAQERLGKTYCFVNNEGDFSEIVAFFTVSNDSVKTTVQIQYGVTVKEDKEKEKTRRENLSKFIYQLANTCFTAMVVVAAVGLVLGVEDAKPYALLLGVGLFSTIFLALFADNILKRK